MYARKYRKNERSFTDNRKKLKTNKKNSKLIEKNSEKRMFEEMDKKFDKYTNELPEELINIVKYICDRYDRKIYILNEKIDKEIIKYCMMFIMLGCIKYNYLSQI